MRDRKDKTAVVDRLRAHAADSGLGRVRGEAEMCRLLALWLEVNANVREDYPGATWGYHLGGHLVAFFRDVAEGARFRKMREAHENAVENDWPANALALTRSAGDWLTLDCAVRVVDEACFACGWNEGAWVRARAMAYLDAPNVAVKQAWREFLRTAWFPTLAKKVDDCPRALMRGKLGTTNHVSIETRCGLGRMQVELTRCDVDATFTGWETKEDREGYSWGFTSCSHGSSLADVLQLVSAAVGGFAAGWSLKAI